MLAISELIKQPTIRFRQVFQTVRRGVLYPQLGALLCCGYDNLREDYLRHC